MIEVNKVVLVGRLTKDIELRKTPSNVSVCDFTVAINRRFNSSQNGEKTADFINCTAWRQSADFLASYAGKGTVVYVEGRIQNNNYDGPNGRVYQNIVVADNVQIMNSRSTTTGTTYSEPSYQSQPETFTPSADSDYSESVDDGFESTPSLEISSDDLPFY
ncbi:MAG: single-stranded DNA-binding protein [Erysipelotrichaceae bacterium]|nr:single-stranded DNA-binding protein [Erysipelotrichaceae bacterium]